jgi:hypothetical protein
MVIKLSTRSEICATQAEQDQARDTGSPRLVISLDIAAIKNRNNGQSGEANGGGQRVSCGAGP